MSFGGPHLNEMHHEHDCLCIHCWRRTLARKVKSVGIPTEAKLPEGFVDIDMTPGSGKVPTVGNGVHRAYLAAIDKMPSAFDATKTCTILKFCVKGQDPERDGTLNLTPSRTPKGKVPWAAVLTAFKIAHTPGTKMQIQATDLLNKECDVLVNNEPGTRDPSKTFPRIKALIAVA